MTKVFISHRQADVARAKEWANYLTSRRVDSYLDVLDPAPQKLNGRDVSKYLHDQLKICTHVLVVFTENTLGSMWVPFEIGIATERDIGIAVDLHMTNAGLPEYLLEWPILKNQSHYDAFVLQLKKAETEQRSYKSMGMRYSDGFHVNLKRAISQG